MTPRVTVLMPIRNGLPWIREALDGLSRQTFRDFELLVIDDGSTDGTSDFLRAWRDDRLRVIPASGVGMAAALNLGLGEARAPLVARHDADDVSAPLRLDAQVDYLRSHPSIDVLASAVDYIDAHGRAIDNAWVKTIRRQQDVAQSPAQIAELMPLTCCVTHGSVMARTSVLRAAGGYLQNIWPVEDYDLWLRLLPAASIAKLPHRLYRYRVHDAQLSAQAREQQLAGALSAKFRYLRRVCPELPTPARLVVVGTGRGADCYRALASAHGFEPTSVPAVGASPLELASGSYDALVVANFADVDACRHVLDAAAGGGVVRVGNFFVPGRWARQEAA